MRFFSVSLCVVAACALPAPGDSITVTLLDQASQLEASAGNGFGQSCNQSGSGRLTVCSVPGIVINGGSFGDATASASLTPGAAFGNVVANPDRLASAGASTFLTDTVLITGGSGTGYLNLEFYATTGSLSSGASLTVNGQSASVSQSGFLSGVFTFQFGQAFTLGVGTFARASSLRFGRTAVGPLIGARVYTVQPTSCNGLCSDPNFTSADVLGEVYGVNATPEPNTVWLTLVVLPVMPLFHRFLRHQRRRSN